MDKSLFILSLVPIFARDEQDRRMNCIFSTFGQKRLFNYDKKIKCIYS